LVCANRAGQADRDQELFFDDGDHAAFLSRYPLPDGYSLVCTRRHLQDARDLSEREYLGLQAAVHRVA
jgi:diadenosine tetraphosphate (Ap4A) HIT family hydrolase